MSGYNLIKCGDYYYLQNDIVLDSPALGNLPSTPDNGQPPKKIPPSTSDPYTYSRSVTPDPQTRLGQRKGHQRSVSAGIIQTNLVHQQKRRGSTSSHNLLSGYPSSCSVGMCAHDCLLPPSLPSFLYPFPSCDNSFPPSLPPSLPFTLSSSFPASPSIFLLSPSLPSSSPPSLFHSLLPSSSQQWLRGQSQLQLQ